MKPVNPSAGSYISPGNIIPPQRPMQQQIVPPTSGFEMNEILDTEVVPIPRTQLWYTYKGINCYTLEMAMSGGSYWGTRTVRKWIYVCIPHRYTDWDQETPMKEITDVLYGFEFEHIRKEISQQFDPPYAESWREPTWYILAGFDYQHDGMDDDMSQDYLIYDAVRRIDAMIEAEVLKNNPKFVKSNNEQQGE